MALRKRQIIAMGGGSFTVTPDNPRLERYVLRQTGRKSPKIAFIATATGDADVYVAKFYAAFNRLACRPSHVPLFGRTPDLRKALLTQDVIYVGGGNTKSMLAVWREWGLPAILREAWRRGIVLTGVSAGAICWFEHGLTDSWAGSLEPLECLGFLGGGCCPHYDGEADRRPYLHRHVAAGRLPKSLALDDCAAAHFIGRRLVRCVSARPDAGAYDVIRRGTRVSETARAVERLLRNGEVAVQRRKGRGAS